MRLSAAIFRVVSKDTDSEHETAEKICAELGGLGLGQGFLDISQKNESVAVMLSHTSQVNPASKNPSCLDNHCFSFVILALSPFPERD